MRTYILSYKGNEKMARRLEKQLQQAGFPNIETVYAPDMAKVNKKPNEVVYHTFKTYLLPKMEKHKDDVIYFEDDADITSPYKKYKEMADKGKLSRISYWQYQKNFIGGSTAVGFKREIIPKLAEEMRKRKEQHIDGFFTKFGNKLPEGDHYVAPKNERLGGTISHESYIEEGRMREGYRGSDQKDPKTGKEGYKKVDNTKLYMTAGFVKEQPDKFKELEAPEGAGTFNDFYGAPTVKKGFGIKRIPKKEGGSAPDAKVAKAKKIKVKKESK
jgi:hypothetical protein